MPYMWIPRSVTVGNLWRVHTSSRTTSTGLSTGLCTSYLSLSSVCHNHLWSPPFPVRTFTFPKLTARPVRPSVYCLAFILTCHRSLSPLCPYVSLSHGPPKAALCRCVHLSDRHSVAQWEAILPPCEAIVVCNIMDREVKQRYWFSCRRGELCEARVSPYAGVSRGSCSPLAGSDVVDGQMVREEENVWIMKKWVLISSCCLSWSKIQNIGFDKGRKWVEE